MKSVHKAIWYDADDVVRGQIRKQAMNNYYVVFDNTVLPVDEIIYDRFTSVIRFTLYERLQH